MQELRAQKFAKILPDENQRRTQHYVLVHSDIHPSRDLHDRGFQSAHSPLAATLLRQDDIRVENEQLVHLYLLDNLHPLALVHDMALT